MPSLSLSFGKSPGVVPVLVLPGGCHRFPFPLPSLWEGLGDSHLPFGDNQKVVTACPPLAPLSGKGLEVALAFRKNQMIVIADPPLPLLF